MWHSVTRLDRGRRPLPRDRRSIREVIVAAAPHTETSLAPSVLNLAFDLGTTLDVGMRLGPGEISVHPKKLGVLGHRFGGSAAVFTATGMPVKPKAVIAAFPTITKPPAEEPGVGLCKCPA